MATWDEDIVTALENLGGAAQYKDIYSEIKKLRTNLPKTWKDVVRRRIQDLSSDSAGFKNGQDLFYAVDGIGGGAWGLRAILKNTPKAIDLPFGDDSPIRASVTTYRVLRDTSLARKLKSLYENKCQICGMTICLDDENTYSEAHHIIPLGQPHNGPDTSENLIVLCPNHHVMCDYGAIELSLDLLIVKDGHTISQASIDYHNSVVRKVSKT
jgi:hypothetical protein